MNENRKKDVKAEGTSRNTDLAQPRTPGHDQLDDQMSGLIDNDLEARVSEGNQRATQGWHTEEKPLSKRASKRAAPARPAGRRHQH